MKSNWAKRLHSMTIEDMYALHLEVKAVLEERLNARKAEIDRRLGELERPTGQGKNGRRSR